MQPPGSSRPHGRRPARTWQRNLNRTRSRTPISANVRCRPKPNEAWQMRRFIFYTYQNWRLCNKQYAASSSGAPSTRPHVAAAEDKQFLGIDFLRFLRHVALKMPSQGTHKELQSGQRTGVSGQRGGQTGGSLQEFQTADSWELWQKWHWKWLIACG